MKPGDVLLAPLPQSDGRLKDRPVLFLCTAPPFGDYLVRGISTQVHQAVVGLDHMMAPEDRDFASSGLKAASVIRTAYLALLPRTYFKGRIGAISPTRTKQVLDSLVTFLARANEASP
jgi:mRNA interferase MazF